jgi:predicted metal-dependent hydrolase
VSSPEPWCPETLKHQNSEVKHETCSRSMLDGTESDISRILHLVWYCVLLDEHEVFVGTLCTPNYYVSSNQSSKMAKMWNWRAHQQIENRHIYYNRIHHFHPGIPLVSSVALYQHITLCTGQIICCNNVQSAQHIIEQSLVSTDKVAKLWHCSAEMEMRQKMSRKLQ